MHRRCRTLPRIIGELAERFGDAPALLSDRETFSYRELSERANRYARWALAQGLAKGDTVCLLMPNRPEYMAVWLGITQVGGVVALINTNLTGTSLAYCIDVVAPKHVIIADTLLETYQSAKPHLTNKATCWTHGVSSASFSRIDSELEKLSSAPLAPSELPPLTIEDHALYIYTSGTTGMPKAANVNHYRLMLASFGFAGMMNTQSTDRIYNCLPMYHTAGGLVATGALLVRGGSVAIRERFSANEFWNDISRWDCTIFQYIGELCRYLLNTPPHPREAQHRLRLACGNGLRPDIWMDFKNRFQIPQILEFYSATEGNVSIFNLEGRLGAIGRVPWFLSSRFPVRLVKFDFQTEQPMRDSSGFCVACATGEVGEMIGHIVNDFTRPANRFEGYANKAESEKKILRDVFEKGDAWFRTGDLMRKDEDDFFYFVDRIGDTFRWKGENVSTSEVSEAISAFPGIAEATVYGVSIPGKDGKAGMAAIVSHGPLDLAKLRAHLIEHLPDYAQPLFLRIRGELETTSTFKQKKTDLVQQGFDPASCSDAIYFDDPSAHAFVPIDAALYRRIMASEIRI
jgi:fatty-acyl-CoA synthase